MAREYLIEKRNWNKYLENDDFEFLVDMIDRIKSDTATAPFDLVVLQGTGGNGKTTLISDVVEYIGQSALNKDIKLICCMHQDTEPIRKSKKRDDYDEALNNRVCTIIYDAMMTPKFMIRKSAVPTRVIKMMHKF